MSRSRRLAVSLLSTCLVAAGLLGAASPAGAASVAVDDEAGDASRDGLDFTRAALRNREHAVVARMRFVADERGEVIVAIRARHHGVVALAVVRHRPQGDDRDLLVDRDGDRLRCGGLTSTFVDDPVVLTVRVPARCLRDGDYGAVRSWFLTEEPGGGADVDFAPDTDPGWTPWVARG